MAHRIVSGSFKTLHPAFFLSTASLIVALSVLCGPSLLPFINACADMWLYVCTRWWSQLTSCCRTWTRPKTESCGLRRTTLVRSGLWIWTSRSSWAGIRRSVFSIKTYSLKSLNTSNPWSRAGACSDHWGVPSGWSKRRTDSGYSNGSKYQHVPSKFKPYHNQH